jgi:hypothetical protein
MFLFACFCLFVLIGVCCPVREYPPTVARSSCRSPATASIRNTTLDIISRLPANEAVEPYAANLLSAVMDCLSADNEENALVCLRILFELFKNVKTSQMEVGDLRCPASRACRAPDPTPGTRLLLGLLNLLLWCQMCASKFVELARNFFQAFGDILTRSFSASAVTRTVEAPDPIADDVGGELRCCSPPADGRALYFIACLRFRPGEVTRVFCRQ